MTIRKRILIVEDEALLAMVIQEMVGELGYEPIGPAITLEAALEISAVEGLDGAILDANLGGGATTKAVAERLEARGVPYLFATGDALLPAFGDCGQTPVLNKPFTIDDLSGALTRMFG